MFQLRNNESNSSESHSQDYIQAQWKERTVEDVCVQNRIAIAPHPNRRVVSLSRIGQTLELPGH